MGAASMFCCFKALKPNITAIVGLVANILAIVFLIWGLAKLYWSTGIHAVYIVSFILLCSSLVAFIVVVIFLFMNGANNRIYNIGKLVCIVILAICGISFILILVLFIVELKDYIKLNKDWKDEYGINFFSGSDWAALIVPVIISLVSIVAMSLTANRLFKEFSDRMISVPVYPSTTMDVTNPTIPQPGLFPNNNGPIRNSIIVVNFVFSDTGVNFSVSCFENDSFATVEDKLYKEFPEYRTTDNEFMCKGAIVLRHKTISENNIKNGDTIVLQKILI